MNDKQLLKRLASLSPEQRELLLKQLQKKKAQTPQPKREGIQPIERDSNRLPMSYAQQRLWFLEQLQSGNGSYNITAALRLNGSLDVEALRMSFEEIVGRHEALRTTFVTEDGQGRQVINPSQRWELPTISLEPLNEAEQEDVIRRRFRGDATTPFDLINGPLLRTRLIRLGAHRHVLIVTMHHIISDGWSMGVLIREVVMHYAAFLEDKSSPLPPLKVQYADYSLWQREWLAGERLERQLNYWRTRLDGVPVLELPTDFPRPPAMTYEGASLALEIDPATTAGLQDLARKQGATLFMVLLSALQVLLHRYSGQDDICVGTPIAGRTRPELEALIGCFVNTLAIRSDLADNPSFSSLLRQVQQNLTGAYDHQDIPFERLVDELGIAREMSHTPLFQLMFVLQNATPTQSLQLPGLKVETLPEESHTSKFDITLSVREEGGRLVGSWEYRTDLFKSSTIKRMQDHWAQILRQVARNPAAGVDDIDYLTAPEQKQLLIDWNNTRRAYERDACIAQVFADIAAQNADRIAARDATVQWTYAELDARANAVAAALIDAGVNAGERVGLCAERTLAMVAGVLGIVKAGACYLPLDPAYPSDRLAFMLEDGEAAVLLCQDSLRERIPVNDRVVVSLDATVKASCDRAVCVTVPAQSAAYVMYTSGSTGRPKGIEVVQRNVVRLVRNTDFMRLCADVNFLNYAPISFDAATLELWGPLLNGGSVSVAPPGNLSPEELGAFIRASGVNAAWLTAALFHYFAQFHLDELKSLKQLLAGGDVLSPALVRKVLAEMPGLTLINGYGPTENTTFTCCFAMRSVDDVRHTVPIGRPIANTRVYVLDKQLRPVPVGVPGELYTSGDGVANGYLNRDDLTRDAFVANPFSDGADPVMYKTGDQVRYHEDGVIEYLGRIDQQVKIRGFRIELGEIEEAVVALQEIEQCAVIAREDTPGTKRLVGYVVPKAGQSPSSNELRTELKQRLPDYMVPSVFVVLDVLPVTANGKLDRRALPKPQHDDTQNQKVRPRNDKERVLAEIWMQVLNVQDIGVYDNFFELGGDSILSIQITSRAKLAGLHITTKQVFENQTVAELALAASDVETPVLAEQGMVQGDVALAPVQQWFFAQRFASEQHWNQSVLLDLKADFNFSEAQVGAALSAVVLQHDALRMRFDRDGQKIRQWHDENPDGMAHFSLHSVDLTHIHPDNVDAEIVSECNAIQASLSLQFGPLLAAGMIRLRDGARKLLLVVHHLVIDGVSWRVLVDDFTRALIAVRAHDDVSLGMKTTSYKQWVEALTDCVQQGELDSETDYWLSVIRGSNLNLPIDHPEGRNSVKFEHTISVRMSGEYTEHLLRDVNRAYRTDINDILLTALAKTLSEWTGSSDFTIDMEGHGREMFNDRIDLSRTVGWFTSIYPVRLGYDGAAGWASNLKANKQRLHSIPRRGFGFGALLNFGREDWVRRELSLRQRPQIVFNYLGQFDNLIEGSNWFGVSSVSRGHEHGPDSQLPHILSINSHIVDGALQIDWIHSSELFEASSIQSLADAYGNNLRRLIDHCMLEDAFGYTPSDFPLAGLSQSQIDRHFSQVPGIEAAYPLSPMQEGMLFHSLFDNDAGVYFEQLSVEVVSEIDRALFLEAWNQVLKRHPVLRSAFLWQDMDRPLQVVHAHASAEISNVDLRDLQPSQVEGRLNDWLERDRQRGFEFEKPGLTRMSWLMLPEGRARLIWSFHHIVLDGWSLPLVIGEVFMIYTALAKGRAPQLTHPGRYEDFIGWLERIDKADALQFWKHYLEGFQAPTPLAAKRSWIDPDAPALFLEEHLRFSGDFTQRLQQFARENHVTLNTLLQAAWGILLARYSGENDVVFGTTVSGRPADLNGVEHIVGLFINTLPFRVRLNSDTRILALLQTLQEEQLDVRRFESTPLVDIHKHSDVPGDQSMFDSILVFENYPVGDAVREADDILDFGHVTTIEHTNFPLTLIAEPGPQLLLKLSFDANLFERVAIARMLSHLEVILHGALAQPDVPVLRLPLLSEEERNKALHVWNPGAAGYPRAKTVDQLFESVAAQQSEAIAIIDGDTEISYGELNRRANQLARYMIEHGVQDQDFVALALERSVDMLVAMLATFKAGGAYLPVDPAYPEDRIQFMLADTRAPVLITHRVHGERLAALMASQELSSRIILLDAEAPVVASRSGDNLLRRVGGDAGRRAYAVYTSGSTGKPKGVVCTHLAINRLVIDANYFHLRQHDRMAHLSNVSFDAATWEIWGAFLNGSTLVVINREQLLTPEAFVAEVERSGINCVFITTALFNAFAIHQPQMFPRFKYVLFGGEACDPQQVRKIARDFKPQHFLHVYGPSENTTYSTWYEIQDVADHALTVPIGRSLSGSTAYILDRHLQPVPVGVAGEIHVGGDGLAIGYLNDPERTEKSFIAHPFGNEAGDKLYKTGDLARYTEEGDIEILGRADDQVKIRGFRIELGEVEAQLTRIAAVREAVVIVKEDAPGQKKLVAYVIGDQLDAATLRRDAARLLPKHMVPSAFVVMEQFPLTQNGKVNKRALPEPGADASAQAHYVAPRTDKERILAGIWEQVLKADTVGIHDNFFELGGDSILSIQIISRAKRAGLHLTAKQIFEFQTVSELAEVASELGQFVLSEQGLLQGECGLLPVQSWFFDALPLEAHHFNQSLMLNVDMRVSASEMRDAWEAVIQQHDALRLVFARQGDTWTARYREVEHISVFLSDVFAYETIDVADAAEANAALLALAQGVQASLELGKGPLIRVVWVDAPVLGTPRMLVVIHHLVVDVFSWRVMLEDLQTALDQLKGGKKLDLGQKGTSYRQWVQALTTHAQREQTAAQEGFWRSTVEGEFARLPARMAGNSNARVATIERSLDVDQTRALLTDTWSAYRTEINDLLLTALSLALAPWVEGSRILVDLEGHGREYIADNVDISRTVGWFTTVYPVALPLTVNSLRDRIMVVKEGLRAIPEKGLGYGCQRLAGKLPGTHQAGLSFNYLGQLDQVKGEAGWFTRASESVGDELSPNAERRYPLDVSGRVLDGVLTMSWRYGTDLFSEQELAALADRYQAALRELIAHCRDAENGCYTPSDFPLAALSQGDIDRLFPGRTDIDAVYPLSPVQEGMLFHSLYEPGSWVYFDQLSVRFHGPVNDVLLFAAWKHVMDRHAILRTGFVWEGVDRPLQVVRRTVEPEVSRYDWSRFDEAECQRKLARYLIDDRNLGFNFRKPGVLRFSWIRMPDDSHQFVWSFHHILLDGWSMPIVFGEMFATYEALVRDATPELPPAPVYETFIAWLQQQDRAASEAFWRGYLRGFAAPTPIPVRNSPALIASRLASIGEHAADRYRERELSLSGGVLARLQQLAKQHHLTMNHVMQGVWATLLYRYSGETDILFGTTVSGRPADLPGVERMIGLFINTLPLRMQIDADKPFIQWLQQLQVQQTELKRHENTSLVDVQQWSQLGGKQPLFDSILVYENYPIDDSLESSQAELRIGEVDAFQQTNFPLTLIGIPVKDSLIIRFSYDSVQFEASVIDRMLGHIVRLMESVADDAMASVRSLDMLTLDERAFLTQTINQTAVPFPDQSTIAELFDEVVARHGHRLAWTMKGVSLSYAQLADQANRLANFLVDAGVRCGDRVVASFDRSAEMIASMIAILKAGAAVVSVDPSYPEDRMRYMLDDTDARIVLTSSTHAERFGFVADNAHVQVHVWEEIAERVQRMPYNAITTRPPEGSAAVASVIYTSGSTGRPKGVLLPNIGLIRLAVNTHYWTPSPGERILHAANLSFDASNFEIYGALLNGLTLVGADKDTVLDAGRLSGLIVEHKIEHVFVTTALFNLLTKQDPDVFSHARYVMFGGEACDPNQIRAVISRSRRPAHVLHMYGPAENSTYSTWHEVTDVLPGATTVPIGRSVSNSTLYVLDGDQRPVPLGVPGEIYVGGPGLARGYLNRPDLTEMAFLPDPFAHDPSVRMYKTGDLGRLLEDGVLEIIGRADDQVKIRGFRIELGEIENVLAQQPAIRDACVLAHEDEPGSGKMLVAYLTLNDGAAIVPVELRARLRSRLPDFMVPRAFVTLDALPITPNGKVDKRALPKPGEDDYVRQEFVGARNDIEHLLVSAWIDVLGVSKVGIHDDFFEMGGHSLLVTKVASRIKDGLGIEVPLRTLFEVPTIAGLAEILGTLVPAAANEDNADAEEDFEEGSL